MGIELLEIIDLLTNAHILHRNAQLGLDCNCNAAFCCSVLFCKNDACDIGSFHELFCLNKCVLACGTVKNHQSLTVSFRKFFVNDAVDLL